VLDADAAELPVRTVRAGGLRLRVVAWTGDGPPCALLLHATSFCADVWAPVWAAAREAGGAGLGAVAVDVRGHGRSEAPASPEAYGWGRLVDDAIAVAEAVGEGAPLVLAGHSSGATAALVAAARRPDLVRGVFAVEPVLWPAAPASPEEDSFPGSRALAARARKRRHAFPNRHEARLFLEARFPYAGFAPAALEAFLAGGLARGPAGATLRCRPEVEAALYEGAASLDLGPLWRGLRVPLRLVLAEHGATHPGALARLEAAAPLAVRERVPGTTHFAALEDPVRVGRALGAFLAELGAGGAAPPAAGPVP